MIDQNDDILEHFGVKGMKWGVRKAKPTDRDAVLAKNTKIVNVSTAKPRDISNHVYGAHTKKDIVNYRGNYAFTQQFSELNKNAKGDDPRVFFNAFATTKAINVAGRETQVKAFRDLWDKDPEGVARSIAEAQKDIKFSAAFNARILKLDRTDKYQQRIMAKGEDWIKTKGLFEFNQSFGITSQNNADGRKLDDSKRNQYVKLLEKRGYDAVVDLNDIKNYGSESPVLIFKGSKVLKREGAAVPLTSKHIQKASEAYMDAKKLKKYVDDVHGF